MKKLDFRCTVCGAECSNKPVGEQKKVKGWQKQPICIDCYNDDIKYQEWLNQLRYQHPDLYKIEKMVGRVPNGL